MTKLTMLAGLMVLASCAWTPSPEEPARESDALDYVLDNANTLENVRVEQRAAGKEGDNSLLYLLLTAELAGQREQYDTALDAYFRAAQQMTDARLAERAVKIALYLKAYDKAGEAMRVWLSQDPDNLTAHKIAALLAVQQNDATAALEHLSFLLGEDPVGFENTLLEMVKIAEAEGYLQTFDEVLQKLSRQYPDESQIFFVQALLSAQGNQSQRALNYVERALALRPNWSRALLLKAQLLLFRGDDTKAREVLQQALQRDPGNRSVRKMLAQVLVKTGDLYGATQIYQKMLRRDANDAEALYELGLVHAQLKQFKQARQMFQQLLEQPSWRAQASLLLGKLAVEEQQIDKALGWFDSITQGPLAFEASLSSVSLLMNQKRVQEALGRVKIMQTSFPEQKARLMMIEAEIYNGQKQYQRAFDILTLALQEKPRQKELLYARALVAEKLDKLDVLEDDLRKILVDHPDDANALNALGYTLADRTERYVEAEEYLKRALELAPEEAVIIDSYGWLLYRLGRLEEAEDYLRRAYQRLPEGEIAAHWIEVLLTLGRIEEARKVFAEALLKAEDKQHLFDLQRRFEVLR